MDTMERSSLYNNAIEVENETQSCFTRTTVDGRRLRYELNVLQQPERARACGQGAKSSTDRRPVDPPPIIELKIKEGEHFENDVTFKTNANYVMFATLEQARHIAKARNQPEKSAPPVLTGSPVAGIVYLERPSAAGYFIFSDLSVRHEGKYRLSFSLFEEVKEPQDVDKSDENSDPNMPEPMPNGALTYRMDVKSKPFVVYSAKKFPGLSESTSLSRMVAEQGCRVRIRRDVRMRRREQKAGPTGEWDGYEESTAETRARMSATPDPRIHTPHGYMEPIPRPRSASNTSHQSHTPAVSRRPSMQDVSQPYAHPHYAGAPPAAQQNYAHTVAYSPQPYQAPSFAPPQGIMPPPQFQTSGHMGPSVPAAQQSPYYPYPQMSAASAGGQPQYEQRPSVNYGPPMMPEQHHMMPQTQSTTAHSAYNSGSVQQSQMSAPQSIYQQSYQPTRAAPENMESAHRPMGSMNSSSSRTMFQLPPIGTSGSLVPDKLEAASPSTTLASSTFYPSSHATKAPDTNKRSYGKVFNEQHQNRPLRNGERPRLLNPIPTVAAGSDFTSTADDDDAGCGELDPTMLGMHYRRADGRHIRRALPLIPDA